MEIGPQAAGAAIGSAATWLWEKYGKEIIDLAKGRLSAKWSKVKWPEAAKKYKTRIEEMYSTMRVIYKAETIPLGNLYVDLFILEEPEAYRRFGVDYLESDFDDTSGFINRSGRASALSVVDHKDRLFVLGKPGAGKTTLLKHLATLAAAERIDKVPIFISFNNWAYSQKDLLDYMVEQFEMCDFPDAKKFVEILLKGGDALLLFDGLDEVSEENNLRGSLIHELETLLYQYKDNKVIISCRNAASDYQFERFTYVEIADFTDKQVSIFAKKWFANDSDKREQFLKTLAQEEHQSLKELSHNPLLLGMLCLVFEETSNFPSKRGEIYRDAIDALTKKWDKQRGIQRDKILDFSPENERKLLSFLAYDYFLHNKIFFEQNDIEVKISTGMNRFDKTSIDSEAIITAIEVQHGLLVRRAHRIYTFAHLTFQEYFTAKYIIDNFSNEGGSFGGLFEHLYNPRWREVFLLTASLLPNADPFFNIFSRQMQFLIKENKLSSMIKRANTLAHANPNIQQIFIARMVSIAIIISIGRIVNYVRTYAVRRDEEISGEFLRNLSLDSADVSEFTLSQLGNAIIQNKRFDDKLNAMFRKLIKLSIKRSSEQDFNENPIAVNESVLYSARTNLREYLQNMNKELEEHIKKEIQEALLKPTEYGIVIGYEFFGYAFKITQNHIEGFLGKIIHGISKADFPPPYATLDEWKIFTKALYQEIPLNIEGDISQLTDDQLDALERFLKSNMFFIDCLKLASVSNFEKTINNTFYMT